MKKLYATLLLFTFTIAHFASSANDKLTAKVNAPESDDLINQIIESIPSPLEITVLMKDKNIVYNKTSLNSADNASRYITSFKQALNLGIYSTDLGYSNIYGKTQDALEYLKVVKNLADNLTIGDYFDYETLKSLAESTEENNLAQLIQTTTTNFEKINNHLREQKRESISILLLTGGWIEATYLTTLIYKKQPNKELREKIGEQKIVLERLLLVLDIYKSKPGFQDLLNDMYQLQRVYDEIEIMETAGTTTVRQENGQIVIDDTTVTEVIMTDAHIQQITTILTSLRSGIIQ